MFRNARTRGLQIGARCRDQMLDCAAGAHLVRMLVALLVARRARSRMRPCQTAACAFENGAADYAANLSPCVLSPTQQQ